MPHRLHAWSARLALMAMLLLALLPGVGRMHSAVRAAPAPAQAMCTMQGLRTQSLPPARAGIATQSPGRIGGPVLPAGDDCAYCPLLAATLAGAVPPALLAPATLPAPVIAFAPAGAPSRFRPGGAGSRGPPASS